MYALPWADADLSPFDHHKTDRAKIDSGHPVPCRMCEAVFRVLTLTARYCATCEQGYCQPHHGGWVGRRGACIQCGPQQARPAQQPEYLEAIGVPLTKGMTLGKASVPVGPQGQRPRVPFEVFWERLKEEFSKEAPWKPGLWGLIIQKWSAAKGPTPETFPILYEGKNTFTCATEKNGNPRNFGPAEVCRVYEVWPQYKADRTGRAEIVKESWNSTWIIALLKHFEELMF